MTRLERDYKKSIASFEEEIARLVRRLELLKAVQRGDASLRAVKVKAHDVPGYRIGAHTRYIRNTKKGA